MRVWSDGRRLLLLSAVLAAACTSDVCDEKGCDPTTQDCSASPFCCTPATPVEVVCSSSSTGGSRHLDVTVDVLRGTAPFHWRMDFGDNQSAQGDAPTGSFTVGHQYATPTLGANYRIQGTITSSQSQTGGCSLDHTVNPEALDVTCEAAPRDGTVPLTVTFDASPSGCAGGSCILLWNFGDGQTASSAHASHTYTQAGSWRAVVTANDPAARTATCEQLIVARAPGGPTVPGLGAR